MRVDIVRTRRRSSALFGNEKMVEVVVAMDRAKQPVTAQELARSTGISHSMVRDVLKRLEAADVVMALPRLGGTRSAQYYEPQSSEAWSDLRRLALSTEVRAEGERHASS